MLHMTSRLFWLGKWKIGSLGILIERELKREFGILNNYAVTKGHLDLNVLLQRVCRLVWETKPLTCFAHEPKLGGDA